jgi:hypothetical protein
MMIILPDPDNTVTNAGNCFSPAGEAAGDTLLLNSSSKVGLFALDCIFVAQIEVVRVRLPKKKRLRGFHMVWYR